MKKQIGIFAATLLLTLSVYPAQAGDAVSPAEAGVTNVRAETVGTIEGGPFYKNASLMLTNCRVFAGTSSTGAVQGLDEVTIELKVGNTSSNVTYTGSNGVASNGEWWCSITVPTNTGVQYLQIKLTDTNDSSFIYPWKQIPTKDSL